MKRRIAWLFYICGLLVFVVEVLTPQKTAVQQIINPIIHENSKKGTASWMSDALLDTISSGTRENEHILHIVPPDRALSNGESIQGFTQPLINGYAGKTSINKGESITFHVSTSSAQYDIEVYRLGYYQGDGARLIQTVTALTGTLYTIPPPDAETGLIEAGWPPAYTLQTDDTWVSGVYLAKLLPSSDPEDPRYFPFVIRDDASDAPILYQIPVTTFQAYNRWGGKSLYDSNSDGGRAYKVSFDRPYGGYAGAGGIFDSDYNMIRYLERRGYNVTYATSIDLHQNPKLLTEHKLFLSNWHDEYYSRPMRNNLTTALGKGVSLAFFSANNIYWQVRFEASSTGEPDRVMVCYKDKDLDPISRSNPWLTTVKFRNDPVNDPESALLGIMYDSLWEWGESLPWVVKNATHWVYAGTGVSEGTQIEGLLGYEYDRIWDGRPIPDNLVLLADSPVVNSSGEPSVQHASIYQAPSGAWVFAAGTMYWAWKLDDNDRTNYGEDPRVQRMTDNILVEMLDIPPLPTETATATPALSLSPTPVLTATVTVMPSLTPTPTSTPTGEPSATPTDTTPRTPTAVATSRPLSSVQTTYIYQDSLAPGWRNWSWDSEIIFNDTTVPYSGTQSIRWTAQGPWAGLYLHTGTGFNTTRYTHLTFALRRSSDVQTYDVVLYDASDQPLTTERPLTDFGPLPAAGTYGVFTIPLTELNAANESINGFQLENGSYSSQMATYVDMIGFNREWVDVPRLGTEQPSIYLPILQH